MTFFVKKTALVLMCLLLCIFLWFGLSGRRTSADNSVMRVLDSTDCNQYPYIIDDFIVRKNEMSRFYERLPNLSALGWPKIEYAELPTLKAPLPAVFEPVLSKGQNILLHRLLDIFTERMNANGLSDKFIIHGATLLGSFRHHDFIPWDDDVDVLVDVQIRPVVQEILRKLEPAYELKAHGDRDKFYTKVYPFTTNKEDVQLSRHTSSYSWGSPFLDISYYKTNSTHINEIAGAYKRYYHWPKSVIFPLSYRPLGPKWYPSPRDPLAFLHACYTPSSQCTMFGLSHILEGVGPKGSIDCRKLGFRYPFVEHEPCDQPKSKPDIIEKDDQIVWSRESLIIRTNVTDRAVIHSFCLPVPRHNLRSETYGFNYR